MSTHWQNFEQRHQDKHIKHCHGDLKTNNIWFHPTDSSSFGQLLILDCVDFDPEFSNIDTLSDVAMLAVNIEVHLVHESTNLHTKKNGEQLTQRFLTTYLQKAGENSWVNPVLEYYLTEKAIVSAYMSILYDNPPGLGDMYLKLALTHAQKLADL